MNKATKFAIIKKSKKKKVLLISITIFLILLTVLTAIIFNYGYKLSFPLNYIEEIRKYSADYNVDIYLVISVIKAESNFYQYAKSHKGAIGLMQILPDTAEWLCKNNDIEYNIDNLYDADYNIRLGTIYLKYLVTKYVKNEVNDYSNAISAYNAGEGMVDKWINEGITSYKNFPYEETVTFTDKVQKNIYNYKKLYYLY